MTTVRAASPDVVVSLDQLSVSSEAAGPAGGFGVGAAQPGC
ncbi:hypothetical protein [Kitasatospora aureofaciens]|nr:hypothetical protein [Kitasatospora aureofaciens]